MTKVQILLDAFTNYILQFHNNITSKLGGGEGEYSYLHYGPNNVVQFSESERVYCRGTMSGSRL